MSEPVRIFRTVQTVRTFRRHREPNLFRCNKTLLIIFLFCLTLLCIMHSNLFEWQNHIGSADMPVDNLPPNPKVILFNNGFDNWNKYIPIDAEFYPITPFDFERIFGCPATNCILTTDRNWGKRHVIDFDAILIYAEDNGRMPVLSRTNKYTQYWVFSNRGAKDLKPIVNSSMAVPTIAIPNKNQYEEVHEFVSPYRYQVNMSTILNDFFILNITSISRLQYTRRIHEDIYTKRIQSTFQKRLHNPRKPVIAYYPAPCSNNSSTSLTLKEMSNYLSIDVYGECGNKKHVNDSQRLPFKDYTFYLSFEDPRDTDYLALNVFNFHTIPVIMARGWKSINIPEAVYINAESFKTKKDLAKYLNDVGRHPEKYLDFFVDDVKNIQLHNVSSVLCELCEVVNSNKTLSTSGKFWLFRDMIL